MPDGDNVQVSTPDGTVWTIPKTNLAAAQARGAKPYTPPQAKPAQAQQPGFLARLSETTLGTQHPVDALSAEVKRYSQHPTQLVKDAAMLPVNLAYQATHHPLDTAESILPVNKAIADVKAKNYSGAAGDVVGGAVNVGAVQKTGSAAMEKLAPEVARAVPAEAVAQKSTTGAKNVLASVFNEGATREKMQMLQDHDALATKAKIKALDTAVESDASKLMQDVSQGVDKKFPEGSTNLQDTSALIKKGLGDRVKAKTLRAKLPPSLTKIMDEASGGPAQKSGVRLTNNELQTMSVLQKSGAKGDELRGSLASMGYAPKQIDAMMQVGEGTEGVPQLSGFEKTKQLRTELGKELFTNASEKYPGAVRRVMFDAWQDMTKQLDAAAGKAGLGDDWTRGKQKYTNYMNDFYGTWERGKFNQSPIDKTLKGQNASEIMEPLSSKTAQQARDLLAKYKGFGLDPKEVIRDVRRYSTNQKIMRFASPSKWDIIIGGMALYRPEWGIPAFIARYGLPRAVERMVVRRAGNMSSARPSIPAVPEVSSVE